MSVEVTNGFIPLFERIMILPDKVETKTKTGILLAVESRKRPNTGTVTAIGHLLDGNAKCPIKVGDKVLYQRYSGLNFTWDSTEYHLVMANDLLAIINKDEETNFTFDEPTDNF